MPLPLPSAPFHFQLDVRVAALRRLRWAGGCCRGPPAPSTGQCAGASEKKQCTSPGPWAPWGGGRRRGEGCAPRPASAGFLGERRSHRSLPDPHRLLQPACAWTPCWWPRTEPCSSAQPPPTVCTRVALRSCALPRTPKAGKRTQNRGFSPLGTYDSFFLAPEVAEQEVVTEKASGRPRPSLPPSGRPRPSLPPSTTVPLLPRAGVGGEARAQRRAQERQGPPAVQRSPPEPGSPGQGGLHLASASPGVTGAWLWERHPKMGGTWAGTVRAKRAGCESRGLSGQRCSRGTCHTEPLSKIKPRTWGHLATSVSAACNS